MSQKHNEKRGEIHLGDLARALAKLQWRDETQAATIAARLGFGLRPDQRPLDRPRPPQEIFDRQRYRSVQEHPAPKSPSSIAAPPPPSTRPPLPATMLPSSLTGLTQRAPAAPGKPDWLDHPKNVPDPVAQPPLGRLPIFAEATSRAILSATLACRRPGAEVDVRALVAAVCRREPLARLPCLPDITLERGCHLLLDYSASMTPWWEDLAGLQYQVQHVVGDHVTQVYSFDRDPNAAFRWTPDLERDPWQPDGRPVLAATDLGIQGRGGRVLPPRGWMEALTSCARHGSPLLILIPWPEPRWPQDFGVAVGAPILMHWSPHTSAAMASHRKGA